MGSSSFWLGEKVKNFFSEKTLPNITPPWYKWNIVESGIKHHVKSYPNITI